MNSHSLPAIFTSKSTCDHNSSLSDTHSKKRERETEEDDSVTDLDDDKLINDFLLLRFERYGNSRNYRFKCKHKTCNYDQTKRSNAIDHLQEHTSDAEAWKSIQEILMKHKSNRREREIQQDMSIVENTSESAIIENSFESFCSSSTSGITIESNTTSMGGNMNKLVARYILKSLLPLEIVDNDSFLSFLDNVLSEFGVNANIKQFLLGRRQFTEHYLPNYVSELYCNYLSSISQLKNFGMTAVCDTITDTNHQKLFIIGIESQGVYRYGDLFSGEKAKKDTNYYLTILESTIKKFPEIFCLCTDSASTQLSCARTLKNNNNILHIRCQAHCLNLILKHWFEKSQFLSDVFEKTNTIIKFFNKYNNATILLNKFSTKRLIKYAATRFCSAFFQLRRILIMYHDLIACLSSKEMQQLENENQKQNEFKINREGCIAILNDNQFLDALKFAVTISEPVVKGLYLFDGYKICIGYVWPIWSNTRNRVHSILGEDAFVDIPIETKKIITESFNNDWENYFSDIFVAAAFINPCLMNDIKQLYAFGGSALGMERYKTIKGKTLDVFNTLIKRNLTGINEKDIENTYSSLARELSNYAIGKYPDIKEGETPISYWEQFDNILAFYSIKLLNFSYCTANVERNHKISALVESTQCNQMTIDNLNMIVKGHMSLHCTSNNMRIEFPTLSQYLGQWTDEESRDCEKWLEQIASFDKVSKRNNNSSTEALDTFPLEEMEENNHKKTGQEDICLRELDIFSTTMSKSTS